MSDRTNLSMTIRSRDPEIRRLAGEAFDEFGGGPEWSDYFEDDRKDPRDREDFSIGASEVRTGSASELDDALKALIVEHGEFAYWVHEEPCYEFLGAVFIHAPGVGDFRGDCDADGNVVERATVIEGYLEIGDIESVHKVLGTAVRKAYFAHAKGD